jgi:hypothetical protein
MKWRKKAMTDRVKTNRRKEAEETRKASSPGKRKGSSDQKCHMPCWR